MEDYIYYGELYDLYQQLFTDKQRAYFEDYYFQNLSLGEMAENYQVSRNAIFKQLHIVTDKLKEYEEKLQLLEKRKKLEEISQSIDNLNIRKQLEELI